jgi:hypothetical protein
VPPMPWCVHHAAMQQSAAHLLACATCCVTPAFFSPVSSGRQSSWLCHACLLQSSQQWVTEFMVVSRLPSLTNNKNRCPPACVPACACLPVPPTGRMWQAIQTSGREMVLTVCLCVFFPYLSLSRWWDCTVQFAPHGRVRPYTLTVYTGIRVVMNTNTSRWLR